jgi:hypothetical protein
MGFQFIEKGSAFPEAFESKISFHAEVKGIPSEVKRLQKGDRQMTNPGDEICLFISSAQKIGWREKVGNRFQKSDGTQDKRAIVRK